MREAKIRVALLLGLISVLAIGCSDPIPSENSNINSAPTSSSGSSSGGASSSGSTTSPGSASGSSSSDDSQPAAPVVVAMAEGAACQPLKQDKFYTKSNCGDGLVCAPESADLSKGSCRVDCGVLVEGQLQKDAEKCGAQRTCQAATSLSFDHLGNFCLPQQNDRDGPCSAVADKEACSNGRICAVSEVTKDESGQPIATSMICRDSCGYGLKDADLDCRAGEKCIEYPYDSTSQRNEQGEPVTCTETKCKGDMSECECDASQGFKCSPFIPGLIAFCERSAGICAHPVPFSSVLDFEGGRFTGVRCNEVRGHAFCDNSGFEGLEKPGQSICFQISETTGDGFCFAFCSSPALDQDQDGVLKEDELGQRFSCPADYECSTDLGRQLGMVAPVTDKNSPNGRKSCDPSMCDPGVPCPEECGVGDAECLTYDRGGSTVSFCGAPYGNCEPAMSLR